MLLLFLTTSCLTLRPHGLQCARLSCLSPSPGMYSNSCPLSQWCHPTISSSGVPFSSSLQSFPASGSFLMSWLFASGGQSIRASDLASVLLMNTQGWFPLGLTGLCTWCTVRPNKLKHQSLGQREVYCRAIQGELVACAQRTPNSQKGFSKAFLKVQLGWRRVGGACHRVCDQFLHSSLIGWWWSVLRCQNVCGLHTLDHQVVNFFHLALAIWKNLGNICEMLLSGYFREAIAETWGRGLSLEEPLESYSVPLTY